MNVNNKNQEQNKFLERVRKQKEEWIKRLDKRSYLINTFGALCGLAVCFFVNSLPVYAAWNPVENLISLVKPIATSLISLFAIVYAIILLKDRKVEKCLVMIGLIALALTLINFGPQLFAKLSEIVTRILQ